MTEEQARQIISPLGGGGAGDGFLPSYIVGETPYASDWLSDEVSGDPIEPEEGLLYLILTHGDYYSGFYRYLESESSYVLVGNARIRELTRSEYFALTEDEKNDGTVYFITDDGSPQPIDLPDRGFTPVGTIIAVMGVTAPKNYLACDGATYNIATYPELSAYFADQFGSANYFGGDGTTTFAVPDLRGEFLRGTGTNSHTAQGNGATVGTHQNGTIIPRIEVTIDSGNRNLWTSGVATGNSDKDVIITGGKQSNISITNLIETGGPYTEGFTTRPTNTSVLYCIAYKDIYIYSVDVSAKGGHEIKDNGVAVTDRDVLNFTDFDIADDSTNLETDIKVHRLTQAEMSEIMSTLPGTPTELPVMFDERGTEYQVAWYVLANGTKKPVYRKMIQTTAPNASTSGTYAEKNIDVNSLNIDKYLNSEGVLLNDGTQQSGAYSMSIQLPMINGTTGIFWFLYSKLNGATNCYINLRNSNPAWNEKGITLIIYYTKTTDTPV